MRTNELGRTGIRVSALCLGSMTWGSQNTETEAHAQLDAALDHGVNFIDTAEMYPVNPVAAETVGRSEEIIGRWLARSGRRGEVVLASKVTGNGRAFIREGRDIDGAAFTEALDGSLKRLRTDCIDLYQLHWPNRGSYHFRRNWTFDPSGRDRQAILDNMLDVLEAAQRARNAGKIRHLGLSNETAWGTMTWLRLAEANGLPRVVSVQNEYSLMCRLYDTDMAEVSAMEGVGCLAFTPQVGGLLSEKYRGGRVPAGSRLALNPGLNGRVTARMWLAADAWRAVARRHGLDVNQMALAFAMSRPFMTATIFGATSMAQLENALAAADLTLSEEVLADIDATHRLHPMPF